MRSVCLRALVLAMMLLGTAATAVYGQVTPVEQEGEHALRVMTYNIKHGQGNDDCEDPPATPDVPPAQAQCAVDLSRAAEVIRAADPDVVALQEIDRFWARSGGVDQAADLAAMLGMESCYAANLDHPADGHAAEPHQYGVLILSKHPILSCENTLYPTVEGWEQRSLLEARVDVPGLGEVAVLNTHLQAGREGEEEEAIRQRTEQADQAAARIAELDVPWVLMGDLNAEAGDPELETLLGTAGAQDAWAVAGGGGDGLTIPAQPNEEADARIDFILASGDLTVTGAEVVVNEPSRITADHFPVVADLAIAGSGTPEATPVV